jgi:hypothetical protein
MTEWQERQYERWMMAEPDPRTRLLDIRARNKWARPKGRVTEAMRIRTKLSEQLAEVLDEMHGHTGQVPLRPSEVVAMNRKAYVIRAAETRPDGPRYPGRLLAPAASAGHQAAVAARRKQGLFDVLRPKLKGPDPEPYHVNRQELDTAPPVKPGE